MDTMTVVDALLALGLTLRLVRLVVADDLGQWWIIDPVKRWAFGRSLILREDNPVGWRQKLASGIDCPWCIGFHVGWLVLLSLFLVGGPGDAAEWWRWTAAAFTLNYIAAHLGPRLGDRAD